MPKIVDHDRRRREIIECTWDVITKVGLAGATIRTIADACGYSNGTLAHYFGDKDGLLGQALEEAHGEVRQMYAAISATRGREGLEALWEYMLVCLPLDEHRQMLAAVEVAFWGQAIGKQHLIDINADETAQWYARVEHLLRESQRLGHIADDVDIHVGAHSLRVLMDGLSIQAAVYEGAPRPDEQRQMLREVLDRLTGGDSPLFCDSEGRHPVAR